MSSDSKGSDKWSDEEVDSLIDRVNERAAERDDVNRNDVLSRMSRRDVLKKGAFAGGLLSLGSASAGGSTTESVSAPTWSNATGDSGTESEPFANLYAKNAYHQVTDTEQLTSNSVDTDKLSNVRIVDPGESIQSAINDLPADGGTVFLAPGTHDISSTITIDTQNNVRLIGAGAATVLRLTSSTAVLNPKDSRFISLRNFKCIPNGNTGNVINLARCYNSEIQDVIVDGDFNRTAINVFGQNSNANPRQGNLIANNTVNGVTNSTDPAGITVGTEYCRVIGNHTYACDYGLRTEAGNQTIVGNNFADSVKVGVEISQSGSNLGKTVFANNTVNHTTGDALRAYDDANQIVENTFKASDGISIRVIDSQFSYVSHNLTWGSGDSVAGAITVEDGSGNSTQNVLYGNFCEAESGTAVDPNYAINEASGVSGNVVRLNATRLSSGFSLNSTKASLNDIV